MRESKPKRISFRQAINAKCKDCIYDPLAGGTWRNQVEKCTSVKSCALWPLRPVSRSKNDGIPSDNGENNGNR